MKASKWITTVLLLTGVGFGGADGQTLTPIYQFGGTDGEFPHASLVQGSDGNFYGTTGVGGYGNGTVFKITSQGTLTTLWQFNGASLSEGQVPKAALVQSSDGNFYGTTEEGGTNDLGTMFKITPQGTLTTLNQFGALPTDGVYPEDGLVQGSDGNFYSATEWGGTNTSCEFGCGTVFKITPQGSLTTLYQFGGLPTEGTWPEGLVRGSDGSFYGMTFGGGTNFDGTVFRITSQGTLTTLYQFGGSPTDGANPHAAFVQGSDGNFYGTTQYGGTNGYGTVFKITPQGVLTTLWQFGSTDGQQPYAGLVQGSDGNFYGTTSQGGTNGYGTVFKISSQGTLTTLWTFNDPNGKLPSAALVQGSDGSFYGTTVRGGTNDDGTVFKLSVPLNPPANQIAGFELLSIFGSSYAAILIPSVAGETYQLQYTDSMNPTNWINSGEPVSSIGGPLTTFDLVGAMPPQRFYRFVITP